MLYKQPSAVKASACKITHANMAIIPQKKCHQLVSINETNWFNKLKNSN